MLLKNCRFIVTQNKERDILENQDILISENKIEKIGVDLKLDNIIDCSDKIVIPGLINLHTHAAMTLFRGYADDLPLMEWLEKKIWPAEAKLTEEHIYHGTSLACLEMLKSGTTCFMDMYLNMQGAMRAVDETGLRAFLGEVIWDVVDSSTLESKMKKIKAFSEDVNKLNNSRIKAVAMPHSIYTGSSDLLVYTKKFADENGLLYHLHVSETNKEVDDSLKNNKSSPIKYLDNLN